LSYNLSTRVQRIEPRDLDLFGPPKSQFPYISVMLSGKSDEVLEQARATNASRRILMSLNVVSIADSYKPTNPNNNLDAEAQLAMLVANIEANVRNNISFTQFAETSTVKVLWMIPGSVNFKHVVIGPAEDSVFNRAASMQINFAVLIK